jgi:hypothetical protein
MQFTHYTGTIETVQKIFSNGLAWVPNRRGLIEAFLPSHDFSGREPQQFGMVSFTELPPATAEAPRKVFGNYGIMVSEEWAFSQKMQKVIYIARKGPVFDSLCALFQYAYAELLKASVRREKEISQMVFTNKVRAGIAGGSLYANLLQLYEYMEPIDNSYQQEWRIVHPQPLYGYRETKEELIKNVSPPKGWAKFMNVLPLEPKDMVGFVCPVHDEVVFRQVLPEAYHNIPLYSYFKPDE